MADKDIIDFNKSQFDIMVDMLVLSGMSKDDAIVKVTKDFEDEGMVLKNRGGMMNINRMTAPLGYYRGGSPVAPESSEGFEPILGNWMKEARMRQAQPPAGAVDMTGQYRPQPERPPWDKAKEVVKGIGEGIKGLGSKSLGALKYAVEELIGAGAAEGSESYISPDEAKGMTKEELEKEIYGFNPYDFGTGYSGKNLRTIQIILDELVSRLGDD